MQETCYFHISHGLNRIDTFEEALECLNNDGFVWFSFIDPSKEELYRFMEPLKLHHVCVDDCLDDNKIPKINEFSENSFLLFNTYHYTDRILTVQEINFFLSDKYLVTVSKQGFDITHPLFEIEDKLLMEFERIKQGPAFLMHDLLDLIVDHKFEAIEKIEDELMELEEGLMKYPAKIRPSTLQRLRRNLLTLRKSIFHEKEVLVKICRNDISYIPENAIFHYRDLYDHLAKFFEIVEMGRENSTSLMQLNLSLINNKMAESANKTNASVRRLTLITTIFMPLTLIAGIGGMSEFTMMTGSENWQFVYPVMLIAMGFIGVLNYIVLKRLEKKDNIKNNNTKDH